MNVAFVQNAQHNIDGDDGSENQPRLGGKRIAKRSRGPLETGVDALRQADFAFHFVNGLGCVPQRFTGSKIEGESDYGKLSLVVNGKRRISGAEVTERC